MGREKGGGFRMGNTCIPVADSFRYLAKPIQYCKVKKKKVLLPKWLALELLIHSELFLAGILSKCL